MRLVDLNILLYAVNPDAPQHGAVRSWWESAMSAEEPIGLTWIVLLGFLRVTTNARVFVKPLTPEQALDHVERWLGHPNTHLVSEMPQHWRILKELIAQTGTTGNLTSDAHLAALAISHGAKLASCDTDFSRFPGLRWENPLGRRPYSR